MTAYYNEFDPHAAAWLRMLIRFDLIPDGFVDDRSILEVKPDDLKGYTQHHFFAGIGGWSLALRRAGWPDDRPVATASLPCQPFSVAGLGKGKEDERHLLPHFCELVETLEFPIIFGEQVGAAIKQGWLDDLYNEMESQNYTVGSHVLTAAGADSPHIRERLYWVAYSEQSRSQGRLCRGSDPQRETVDGYAGCGGATGRMDHATGDLGGRESQQPVGGERQTWDQSGGPSKLSGVVNPQHVRRAAGPVSKDDVQTISDATARQISSGESAGTSATRPLPSGIDWIPCRDGKFRPVKSGLAPLVDGLSPGVVYGGDPGQPINPDYSAEARAARLKGYGNAIQVDTASLFVRGVMDVLNAS